MAILIKVPPQELAPAPVTIEVPKTKPDLATIGDVAYVWFAETAGGRGLVARGEVEALAPTGSDGVRIQVGRITLAAGWLGNADLEAFRDTDEHRPESSLARKIYRYAHNRAVRLDAAETAFLDQRMQGQ